MKLIFTLFFLSVSIGIFGQQVTLTSSPYTQNFNSISTNLPNGWTVRSGATTSNLGTEETFTSTPTSWGDRTGDFKNFASTNGLTATASTGDQSASSNRSLGIRQSESIGDPGAAFVLKLANTSTFDNFTLTFKLQSLWANISRETTWKVDYGIGNAPTSFTTLTTSPAVLKTGGNTFSNQTVSVSLPAALNNQNQPVYIRITTSTATVGGGLRASTGIDDVELTFEQVIGTDPIILLNTTARSGFVTSEGNPSSEQTYTVRGENLTTGIIIAAPTDFEITTTSGNGYTSSITLPQSGSGQVPVTPVFIRLKGTSAGNFNGIITHTSTGAPQKSVALDGIVNPPINASTPIATVRAMVDGTTVTVAGRATVGEQFGGFQIFIQDATGGISTYRSSENLVQENNIAIGDSVQIQGTLASFNELKQINITQVNRVNVPAIVPVPKVIQSTEILANEGQLVRINDVTTPTATFTSQQNYPFTPVQVRITQQSNSARYVNPLVGTSITLGTGYAIGIAGRFNSVAQLLPRLTTDLVRTGEPAPGSTDSDFDTDSTLDVTCWNVEWFGSTDNGPSDENLQVTNVKTALETINADIYNLTEVTDLTAFNNLVAILPDYSGVCSSEVSYNSPDGQRVCFVYKTALFTNITTRHLLKTIKDDPSILTNYPDDKNRFWASGRLPFALTADVNISGSPTQNIMFVGIHARANTSSAESLLRYNMRKYDVEVLKDSLDVQFLNQKIVMLGDFNDDLDVTVAGSIPGNETSYVAYNNDPTRFNMNTRVLSDAGLRSTVGFSDMIDHIISSNELTPEYISGSARVSNVEQYVTNYGSTTSDHYPVMARFSLGSNSPCSILLNLISPTDDILNSTTTKQASSDTGGRITATNVITATSRATYQATSVELNPGFKVDSGAVFLAEMGGCMN
jgi:DNA/RNA endonuclease YhcR with UshA esterase domain